eukprot:COSAG02_NODE_5535_length_4249_cov_2.039036_2_plen_159_part_00
MTNRTPRSSSRYDPWIRFDLTLSLALQLCVHLGDDGRDKTPQNPTKRQWQPHPAVLACIIHRHRSGAHFECVYRGTQFHSAMGRLSLFMERSGVIRTSGTVTRQTSFWPVHVCLQAQTLSLQCPRAHTRHRGSSNFEIVMRLQQGMFVIPVLVLILVY